MRYTIDISGAIAIALIACATLPSEAQNSGSAPDLQAMIDANAGSTVLIPPGEHIIERALRISSDRTRFTGGGTIVQRDPEAPILVIEGAQDVLARDVALTGNIVYDAGRDLGEPPRYRYAVFVGSWHGAPEDSPNLAEGLVFAGNRFHSGTMGIANVSLDDSERKEE